MGYVDGQKKSGHKCPLFCVVCYESLLTCFKCLVEIGYYVINVLSTDRCSNIVGRYACRKLLSFVKLLMCCAGRMYHKGFTVTYIGKVTG